MLGYTTLYVRHIVPSLAIINRCSVREIQYLDISDSIELLEDDLPKVGDRVRQWALRHDVGRPAWVVVRLQNKKFKKSSWPSKRQELVSLLGKLSGYFSAVI